MSIENVINDLKNNDNVNAGKSFNTVMADKLSAALDAKKIEIASSMGSKETKEEE